MAVDNYSAMELPTVTMLTEIEDLKNKGLSEEEIRNDLMAE